MEGEGCNVRGAPTVIDYGIDAGAGAGQIGRDVIGRLSVKTPCIHIDHVIPD